MHCIYYNVYTHIFKILYLYTAYVYVYISIYSLSAYLLYIDYIYHIYTKSEIMAFYCYYLNGSLQNGKARDIPLGKHTGIPK